MKVAVMCDVTNTFPPFCRKDNGTVSCANTTIAPSNLKFIMSLCSGVKSYDTSFSIHFYVKGQMLYNPLHRKCTYNIYLKCVACLLIYKNLFETWKDYCKFHAC